MFPVNAMAYFPKKKPENAKMPKIQPDRIQFNRPTMSALLASSCPSLEDIRQDLITPMKWRIPDDLREKAEATSLTFAPSDVPDLLKAPSPVARVALLSAAAHALFKKERGAEVALSLINLLSVVPVRPPGDSQGFDGTVFDLRVPEGLTDAAFSAALEQLLAKLELKEEVALVKKPFVLAAKVLLTAALGERLHDYAAILLSVNAEVEGAVALAADGYTRENSPLYLSLSAQKLNDIVMNSKLLKKKGTCTLLADAAPALAPLLNAIALVKTNIAKAQHFFDGALLEDHEFNLQKGVNAIRRALNAITGTDVTPSTLETATFDLISDIASKFEAVNAKVNTKQESLPKGRALPFGLITKDFIAFVNKEGIKALTSLLVFKSPQGKKVIPKEPVGTRDLLPFQMRVREHVINLVTGVFKRHGAVSIDTPVFELREVLTEKYGEEAKLIYNLEDQGGELLSLRYDLTVPFARFVACHGINSIKRYQIAKVYRRDRPQIERGRFREFYQCDFDIAGPSGLMIADSEVISIIYELLHTIGTMAGFDFEIKVSHRQLLSLMTQVAGVPPEKFKTICSSVDKLDKSPWSEVRNELVVAKGLSPESADKLWEYIQLNGEPFTVLESLKAKLIEEFKAKNGGDEAKGDADYKKIAAKTIDEMQVLFTYLKSMNVIDKVDFNLSLARGLDYYTGVIFEATAKDAGNEVKVGSIAGGGRYDELIGMFSNKKVPAVGMSIGIERIFAIIEQKKAIKLRDVDTQVFVCSVANNYTVERLQIASMLWREEIPTEFIYKEKPDVKAQFGQAGNIGAKLAVILAPEELEANKIKIKKLIPIADAPEDPLVEKVSDAEEVMPKDHVIERVKALLATFTEP